MNTIEELVRTEEKYKDIYYEKRRLGVAYGLCFEFCQHIFC